MSGPHAASAAVLAGGTSRRMGRPKALLQIDGVTLIERKLRQLRPLFAEVVVIGGDDADWAAGLDVPVIPDRGAPGRGPLAGLVTALATVAHPRVLVTAVDMPFLIPGVCEHLLALADADLDAVVPYRSGATGPFGPGEASADRELEPLLAVYRRSALPHLERHLQNGERSLHVALRDLRVRAVAPEELSALDREARSLINLNTPEDVAALERMLEAEKEGTS